MVLADLAGECFDESIELGEYDEMTARVQQRVLAQIRDDRRRRHFVWKRAASIALVAAVLLTLLTVTAYALGLFRLNTNHIPENVTVHGRWIERDGEGNITYVQDMNYPDTNLTFTFDGDTVAHRVEFKPGWLPMEGNSSASDQDGWFFSYGNTGEPTDAQIPYLIDIFYAVPDYELVMLYQSDIVEETSWNGYEVTKIINHNPRSGDENYVLLFSPEYGYMLRVGGSLDLETLERIAQDLEVLITDEEVSYDPDYNIGCINIGRG